MRLVIVFLALLGLILCNTPGDGIQGCTGHQNPFELITDEPNLVGQVPHGKKFTIGNIFILFEFIDYDGRKFYIGSFKGSAY